jgi:molecular chaperone GrpE (heat shock protein)
MSQQTTGYWHRLWQALLGRPEIVVAKTAATPVAPALTETELRSRLAELELDLRQRDERIEQMKREYAALETEKSRTAATAGQDQMEKILRKVCGPLSNLATLAAATRSGKDVSAADMAQIVGDLQRQLAACGLTAIGEPGQHTDFDIAAHQRMSGGTVHTGTAVVVQIPGYRLGEKVLQKAMVTAKE